MGPTPFDIIIRPIVTEKSMDAMEHGKYTFKVSPRASKIDIRRAIERIYKVSVTKVNTMNVRGKPRRQGRFHEGRTPSWKKAVVTLAPGESIDLFDRVDEQAGG
ncbi:MAG: 50S ribosomal protein L23 [Armatimonadia bacterium]|jgi:large subunit ribosomal protein L23|nr:50S ribosomal protein L23 [Armatimonadia bacterium]